MSNITDERLAELRRSAPPPHKPQRLPFDTFNLLTPELIKLSSEANMALGEYKGFLVNTPNPVLLLSPITTQEAVLSSKLEGTHATLEDILNHEAGNQTDIQDDELKEILNYRSALKHALDTISPYNQLSNPDSKEPLTIKIIKEMHAILLDNVRGSTKHPGDFKKLQNYIGGYDFISYTPVSPQLTDSYMSNLETYLHYDEINPLIQAAIIHAQFEMIHPFEDGNGRIGRLLIPLFFYYRGIIPSPIFYMSSYFERNRDEYIHNLANISKNNNWVSWIYFFLSGIITESHNNTKKALNILSLYEQFKSLGDSIKSYYFIPILDFIFQHPIFTSKQLIEEINASKQTVFTLLNKMVEQNILISSDKAKNRTFICPKLLSIIDS